MRYLLQCNNSVKKDSVCKQSKNYHSQEYDKECKYSDVECQQCCMLSDLDDDNGYFNV